MILECVKIITSINWFDLVFSFNDLVGQFNLVFEVDT